MKITQENIAVLDQVTKMLANLNNEMFARNHRLIHDVSIGQHIRHILEFYQCIFVGLASGTISYDDRERDVRIETDLSFALETIESLKRQLSEVEHDTSIQLCAAYSNEEQEQLTSSLKRELAYVLDHTIHHLAIVKIVLKNDGVFVDPSLGIAPSTLRYRRELEMSNR